MQTTSVKGYVIRFRNVGPDRLRFTGVVESVTHAELEKWVRQFYKTAIIDFDFADDGQSGTVLISGFRPVGTWEVVSDRSSGELALAVRP